MLRTFFLAPFGLAGFAVALSATAAAETCHTLEHQFGKTRICVSSVLAPQGQRSYGPEHLAGTGGDGAWCEGASGSGVGESITLHMDPQPRFRTLGFTNGYTRTDDTFRRNGRIKRALIEAEGGLKRTVTLKDTKDDQKISLPTSRSRWVKLTIVEVYPGSSGSDTCVTWFAVNHEEMNR